MSTGRYTSDHEYVRVEGDIAVVGITHYAQQQLGDVVFVELPSTGKKLEQGGDAAVVESVKAASDVFAPVSGEVSEANAELEGNPALANEDPEGAGWFFKLKLSNPAELDGLMDEAAYKAHIATLD